VRVFELHEAKLSLILDFGIRYMLDVSRRFQLPSLRGTAENVGLYIFD
jgi:hypothetical protein